MILAVHAVVVAAVAVALLFAAVSEEGAEVPCSVDGDRAVPCLEGGEAEFPCSVDGGTTFQALCINFTKQWLTVGVQHGLHYLFYIINI